MDATSQELSGRIIYRKAAVADLAQLSGLLTRLFSQEADFTPEVERQNRGLRLIIEKPEVGQIYCAASGDMIVGMVSILFTISTAEGGLAAWLEDMIVHPDWRNRGIGEQLMQTAINGARSAGCTRITLLTDADNKGAIQFYGRAGFKPSAMIPLRLKL